MSDIILNLSAVAREDAEIVGAKAANLGEMIKLGFLVPEGFVLTTNAFKLFVDENNLTDQLNLLLSRIGFENPDHLLQTYSLITDLFTNGEFSDTLKSQIQNYYCLLQHDFSKNPLTKRSQNTLVAVRSSAVGEDSKNSSFAGQNETLLGIAGSAALEQAIKKCWASCYAPRALTYRAARGLPLTNSVMAVIVQRMLNPRSSGVVFSVNPTTGDQNVIVVEAVWGLGEQLVSGKITPDHYEYDKNTDKLLFEQISLQETKLHIENNILKTVPLDAVKAKMRKLTPDELRLVAQSAIAIQKHYYFPQDCEFSFQDGKLYLLQTRPITTLPSPKKELTDSKPKSPEMSQPFLSGMPFTPGIATSHARVLTSSKDLKRIISGDIVVVFELSADLITCLPKIRGITNTTKTPTIKGIDFS